MKKYKYEGETRDAIEEALAHWKEIEAIIANADDKPKALAGMFDEGVIDEKTCALCQLFPEKFCIGCPLKEEGMHCNLTNAPYSILLNTWLDKAKDPEVTLAVSGMVKALEGILELEGQKLEGQKMDNKFKILAKKFVGLIASMEAELGYPIGGFARDEKTDHWKVIQPNGKFELLVKLDRINNEQETPK